MKIPLTIIITVAALIVVGLATVFLGVYNVSAMNREGNLQRWLFSTAKNHSITRRAGNITVPPLGDSTKVAIGYMHYDEMCVTCHGGPGIEPSDIGQGLNPRAPELSGLVAKLSDAELYWILKNGIKMTGMPAFGNTHTDEQLWDMVAFVRLLPEMSPERYQAFAERMGDDESEEMMEMNEHHEHGHH